MSYAGKWRKTEGMLLRPFPVRSAFKAVPALWSGSSSKVGCRRWVRTIIAGSKIRSPACWTTRQKMCPRQELHLRPQGPQPCVLSAELRGRKWSHHQDLHPAPAHTKGVHRFLCFGGKLRHAGDAPAHPRWQRGVLLIDECRDKWSGGKVLPPRELGVGQPCYCYITAGFSKVAAGVGIAPTSRALQTRAHLSMPSSEKICVREELHLRCLPKGPGFTDQGDTSGSRLARLLKLVRDVGLAPTLRASQTRVRTGYTIP